MIRVLFVDDEPAVRDMAASILTSEGDMIVDTAQSGEIALDKLSTANYDAVVSDYMMPGMNGIDLLRSARGRGYVNLFLIFTGRGGEDVALDAIINGADHYLPKTGKASQDMALIRSILQKRQRQVSDEKERQYDSACHSLLKRMHDGFAYHRIIYDDEGRPVSSMIIEVNTAFERMFSLPAEAMLGKDLRHLIADEAGFEHELLRALNGIIADGKEVRFTERSSTLDRWFSTAVYVPEPGHFVTILTDVTDRMKMEEQLELARKKLYLLGSITRHDLLNQLTALNGYLGIAEHKQDEKVIKDYMRKASLAGEHMRKILEFSRDYERMGTQRPEWLSVQSAVEKAVSEAHNGEAKFQIELDSLEILADPMIEKVFHNLADNAVRHGKATTVRFFYEQNGDRLRIICQDNGTGVPGSKQKELFDDRFGHGLYLVKEVLKMTDMSITETAPVIGACFEITVPKGSFRISGKNERKGFALTERPDS